MNAPLGCILWGTLRNPRKPQSYRPHPHLKLWVFSRVNSQKPQKFHAILNLKKPQNFWNVYPQPRKTSNFEDEVEDPLILRSRLAALFSRCFNPNTTITAIRQYRNICSDLGRVTRPLEEPDPCSPWIKAT